MLACASSDFVVTSARLYRSPQSDHMVLKRGGDVFLPTDSDLANLVGRTRFHSNNDLCIMCWDSRFTDGAAWTNSHIPTQPLSSNKSHGALAATKVCLSKYNLV